MICCSIQHKSARQIAAILGKVEMAEIRLDLCDLSDEDVEEVFSSDTPLIAVCRTTDGDYHRAERLLTLAVKAGARYVDLEIEAPKPVSKRIASACAEWGTTLIRSYHDFEGTPSMDDLKAIVDKCRHHDGEVVKVVTTANSEEDSRTVTGLYKYYTAESLVAFAMGEKGRESRLECLRRGAPFSYAALSTDEATAPGQMTYDVMYKAVYGTFKALDAGRLRMPSSKSYAQRAIIASALAEGTSVLRGYTPCGDSESAIKVAAALGAIVRKKRGTQGTITLEIEGIGAGPELSSDVDGSETPLPCINVGESGLLARLMIPLCCSLYPDGMHIEGEGTLLQRPLQGAVATVQALGGSISGDVSRDVKGGSVRETGTDGRDATVPLSVRGPLKPGRIGIDGSKSSQLVSGALMALPLCERNSSLCVNRPVSIPYIYITMDILRKFGVKVRSEMYGGRQLLDEDWSKCTEIVLKIKENQRYKAAEIDLEGDWSAASAFLAAGAVFGSVALEGLDTTSLQADLTMMDILMEAGASLSQMDEPKGVIAVKKAPLQGFKADLSNSPDLFPVTSVLCAFCQGRSILRGVRRLVHKESDRSEGIVRMLHRMGVGVQVKGDEMTIDGEGLASRLMNGRLLKGGEYTADHDHRMVMALRLAELGASEPLIIDDTDCVAKSFPRFNETWNEMIKC